jgi:internalin A
MLSPLVGEDGVDVWDDDRLAPGSEWRMEIRRAIGTANVALLLVSPSYLASQFIKDEELLPLLRAARERGVIILWVLVSHCLYKRTAIAEFQAAHSVSKPLDSLPIARRNEEILHIAEAVEFALQQSHDSQKRNVSPMPAKISLRRAKNGA